MVKTKETARNRHLYMNPFRQCYFDHLQSYNDLLIINGKRITDFCNFTTDQLNIFWENNDLLVTPKSKEDIPEVCGEADKSVP